MEYLFGAALSKDIFSITGFVPKAYASQKEEFSFLKDHIEDIIYYSAKTEGNMLEKDKARDIILYDVFGEGIQNLQYALDIFNNTRLYEYALKILENELTVEKVESFHSILFSNVPNTVDGFRRVERIVTRFVSISPSEVPAAVSEIVSLFNETPSNDFEAFENAARIFSSYEFIHPFLDGNGRSGRLLMNLYLIKNLLQPIVFSFEEKKKVETMLRLSDALGDASPVLALFVYKHVSDFDIGKITRGAGSAAAKLLFAIVAEDGSAVEALLKVGNFDNDLSKALALYAAEKYNIDGFDELASKSVKGKNERLRALAYAYLGLRGRFELLKSAMECESPFVKSQIIPILIRNNMLNKMSSGELERLLKSSDRFVRMQAVHFSDALDFNQHPELKEVLWDLAENGDYFEKAHALRTLMKATGSPLLQRLANENLLLAIVKEKPELFSKLLSFSKLSADDGGEELIKHAITTMDKDLIRVIIYGLVSMKEGAEKYNKYLAPLIKDEDEFIAAYSRYLCKESSDVGSKSGLVELARDLGKKKLRIEWFIDKSSVKILKVRLARRLRDGSILLFIKGKLGT